MPAPVQQVRSMAASSAAAARCSSPLYDAALHGDVEFDEAETAEASPTMGRRVPESLEAWRPPVDAALPTLRREQRCSTCAGRIGKSAVQTRSNLMLLMAGADDRLCAACQSILEVCVPSALLMELTGVLRQLCVEDIGDESLLCSGWSCTRECRKDFCQPCAKSGTPSAADVATLRRNAHIIAGRQLRDDRDDDVRRTLREGYLSPDKAIDVYSALTGILKWDLLDSRMVAMLAETEERGKEVITCSCFSIVLIMF